MESLSMQLQPFFEWLLRTTLQASLLICLILLFQVVLRSRLGARWHYCLWLLLLIRMAMPWAPQSRVSVFNLIPQSLPQRQTEYIQQDVGDDAISSDAASPSTAESTSVSTTGVAQDTSKAITVAPEIGKEAQGRLKPVFSEVANILPLIWLTGALVLAVYVCASNFNLLRIVKRERPLTDQKILDLLEDCKAEMGIRIILGVVATDKVKSPALFGFVRPRLLLPKGMLETLSREEMRYVFLHELAHLKRHDIYIGWLISLLQVLHWFNPLIWLAFYRVRTDRELACDALVLSRTKSSQAKDYGRTIVNLLERFSRPQRLPAMAGILETKAQLKRRITMIARFKKNSYQWSPLAVILIIILGCVSLPEAKRKKAQELSAAKPEVHTVLRKIGHDWGGFANLSRDGKYMSDVDWDSGDLVITELATGKQKRLTEKGSWQKSGDYALDSAISPDGKQIAYLWYHPEDGTSDLYVVGSDGSGRRLLRRNEYIVPRDWSADGKKILAILFGKDDTKEMVWVLAADGSLTTIKSLGKAYPGKFEVSADGRYIAYDLPQADDSTKRDIFVFSLDRDEEQSVVKHPANDKLLGWTPDGKSIFFTSDRVAGMRDGWLLDLTAGKPKGLPKLVRPQMGDVRPIGFARNGDYYYALSDVRWNVCTAKFDIETGKVLSAPEPVGLTGREILPDWSPDGQSLAYCFQRREDESQLIRIRSLTTGDERELDPKLPYFRCLRWSPDGKSLLVSGFRGEQGLPQVIYRIDAASGQRSVLLESKTMQIREAEWSLDGKSLFYHRRHCPVETDSDDPRTSSLAVRDLQTGKEREIFRAVYPRAGLRRWTLSPDGERVAICVVKDAGGLKIISTTGEELQQLLDGQWANRIAHIVWSPDGRWLLFTAVSTDEPPVTELWRIPTEGGEPEKLLTWEKGKRYADIGIHPDGRHIAFILSDSTYELWVMENFLPAVEGNER